MATIRFVQTDQQGQVVGKPLEQIKAVATEKVAAEATARQAADSALDTRVSTLESRPNGGGGTDAALEKRLTDEVTARKEADSALDTRVSSLDTRVSNVEDQPAGGAAAGMPIFGSLDEAKAWESANPGKKALVYDANGSTVGPVEDPKKSWVPAAPTKTTTSYTIPSDEGAAYSANGATVAADTYTVTAPATVSIKATPAPGYAFKGTATTAWSFKFEENVPAYDTPALAPSPAYYLRMDDAKGNHVPKNRGVSTPKWHSSAGNVITYGNPGNGVGPTSANDALWMTNWVETPPSALTIAAVVTPENRGGVSLGGGYSTLSDGVLQLITFNQPDRAGSLLKLLGTSQDNEAQSDQPTLTPDKAVHLAVTWDGATWTAYVDGASVATKDDSTAYPKDSVCNVMMKTGKALMSGVVIDNKAWTGAQIKALSDAVVRS